jgi:hypothetical protein
MRWPALLILALAAGVLAWILIDVRAQAPGAGSLVHVYDHALLDGLASERVWRVRIDHLERGNQLTLERDALGVWFLTDPLAYPARSDLVQDLLRTLARSRGLLDEQVSLAAAQLAPPRCVLEIAQTESGGERSWRVELGRLDADPRRVYVRVPGHPASRMPGARADGAAVLCIERSLDTTLLRNVDDWRAPRLCALDGGAIVSLRRSGEVDLGLEGGGLVDLALDARRTGARWIDARTPVTALDPGALSALARQAAEVGAERFVDDAPTDVGQYGLDPPLVRLEISDASGESAALRLGHRPGDRALARQDVRWLCMREGFPHVIQVPGRVVEFLLRPAQDLFDQVAVRVRREDVLRVELGDGQERLLLERAGDSWSVTSGATRYPADEARVADVLGTIEQALIGGFPAQAELGPTAGRRSLCVVTHSGAELGGELGPAWNEIARGARGVLFRRFGDERVGWVGEELGRLFDLDADALRSRSILHVEEKELASVRLVLAGRELVYVRQEARWFPAGLGVDAPRAFLLALDVLMHPRAARWLESGPEAGADAIHVVLRTAQREVGFELARAAEGIVLRTDEGLRAELDLRARPSLFEDLHSLLDAQ